jgi:hypothetical protein
MPDEILSRGLMVRNLADTGVIETIDREDARLGFRSSDYGSWQYHRAKWQGGV